MTSLRFFGSLFIGLLAAFVVVSIAWCSGNDFNERGPGFACVCFWVWGFFFAGYGLSVTCIDWPKPRPRSVPTQRTGYGPFVWGLITGAALEFAVWFVILFRLP
jgi:hypothetical protein